MDENIQKIEDKEKEFADRFKRMDDDKDRYLLKPYTLVDNAGTSVPNSLSVTMPYPRIFADHVFGILVTASMQPRVEGIGLSDKQKGIFENFYTDILISIDADLGRRGLKPLMPFIIEEDCLKGTIASRNTLRKNADGTFIPYLLPCDARNLVYEFGLNGLEWAAAKFNMTQSMVLASYPDASNVPSDKSLSIREYWDNEVLEVYAGKSLILEQPNTYGFPPFVIVEGASGPNFSDESLMVNKAESIFAPVRDLYNEINRHSSIIATIEMLSFRGNKYFKNEFGAEGKLEGTTDGVGKIIPIGLQDQIGLIPIQDVYNASRLHQSNLLSVYQQATFSNMEYGTLSIQLSSLAISQMLSKRQAIINHRLEDMKSYYAQTVRMFRDQFVENSYETSLGKEGIEIRYTPEQLKVKHFITYEIKPSSREEEIANASLAQAHKALGLSWDYVLDNDLKIQDVHAELMRESEDLSKAMDPAVVMFRQVFDLRDKGDSLDEKDQKERYYTESELKLSDLENLLRQRAQGRIGNLNPADLKQPISQQESMIPLLGGGGISETAQNVEGEGSLPADEEDIRRQSRETTIRQQTAEGG